jgi:hypothetical protein
MARFRRVSVGQRRHVFLSAANLLERLAQCTGKVDE